MPDDRIAGRAVPDRRARDLAPRAGDRLWRATPRRFRAGPTARYPIRSRPVAVAGAGSRARSEVPRFFGRTTDRTFRATKLAAR
jgi:hypothetical protein